MLTNDYSTKYRPYDLKRKYNGAKKMGTFFRIVESFGSYECVISLPVSVEKEKIKADYKKGVLTIHLPQKSGLRLKEIPISIEWNEN